VGEGKAVIRRYSNSELFLDSDRCCFSTQQAIF
jgi:hypothetical protein